MPDIVKMLIAEKNGTELEFQEEHNYHANNQPFDPSGSPFTTDNTQDAIKEAGSVSAPLVVTIPLILNGSVSNNTWIGYSHLIPGNNTPIISPITGTFVGFTFSNKKSSADFGLEFRLNSTSGSIFYDISVDNTLTADMTLPTPEPVIGGQKMYIQYKDQGANAADMAIILKFKA